jgi:hypothetical protein
MNEIVKVPLWLVLLPLLMLGMCAAMNIMRMAILNVARNALCQRTFGADFRTASRGVANYSNIYEAYLMLGSYGLEKLMLLVMSRTEMATIVTKGAAVRAAMCAEMLSMGEDALPGIKDRFVRHFPSIYAGGPLTQEHFDRILLLLRSELVFAKKGLADLGLSEDLIASYRKTWWDEELSNAQA